ncbi:4-hydroxyphenylpyruvate dioxygenase [Cystobacter ferrugineus]|uniref:4-hydroxyphenylpyruvate dioxygenase n=1 Tax=Cystobacter ferrugineus TaxID=83449 RepID=A0A1L9BBF3_9BACT|nr:4-hydroxyphenylpyruvate dioxygenase [Cystobacter ferrugineus]OJH39561.1 4-hydroxyphenylpyruvate dioxygenase [Cystobacter ferrugineus]
MFSWDGFDYLEMYVGDARLAAYFYCTAFGFRLVAQAGPETGMQDRRSLLLAQGKTRLLLTSALTPDDAVAEYVKLHGDGLKDIALRTSDAVGAFREAVARGARPVMEPVILEGANGRLIRATVGGMGDVVHSFVQRELPEEDFMPGLYQRVETSPSPVADAFVRVDHLAICLEAGTLNQTIGFYERVFGLHTSHNEDVATERSGMNSKAVQDRSGNICFVMMEPRNRDDSGQISEFLALHRGPGVQHVAFLTEDMAAAIRRLRAQQVEFLETPDAYYDVLEQRVGKLDEDTSVLRSLHILADRDRWGYLLQTFTRPNVSRKTLFFELIQRKQARGFGGANIRALYEAVEREQARS